MSFQPVLSDFIAALGEVRFHLTHKDFFVDPHVMEIDDSHVHCCYEIYVNISGDVSFLHGENVYDIKPGDIIFSEPGEVHHCIFHKACVHDHYCLWFDVDEGGAALEFLKKNSINGRVRLEDDNKEKLLSFLKNFEMSEDCFEKTVSFLGILKLLKEKRIPNHSESSYIPSSIQSILEYINDKFLEIESVADIADNFHVSVPTVNRWFREYLHLSPSELIRAKKLSYAEKLLKGDFSVTEACYRAGFTDCSRFISLFKKNYGKTPFQYKKTQLSDAVEK